MSARFWHQIKFERTRLSALLFSLFLNPPWHYSELAFREIDVAYTGMAVGRLRATRFSKAAECLDFSARPAEPTATPPD